MSKKSTSKKNVAKTETLTTINLSKFADRLNTMALDEKIRKDKQLLYKYPETWTKIHINGIEGKKFRQGLRNKLQRISNNIFTYAKQQNLELLQKEVTAFEIFYTENYLLNDFSVKSLSTRDEMKEDLQTMLEIIAETKK